MDNLGKQSRPDRLTRKKTNMEKIRKIAKVCRKVGIRNQPSDFAYWQSKSCEERLACLEEIRQEYHGWKDDTEQRLQRVCTVVKR